MLGLARPRRGPIARRSWSRPIPRGVLPGPLDPELIALRALTATAPRPLVAPPARAARLDRLAAVVVAELVLWTLARFIPIEVGAADRRGDPGRRAARLAHRRRAGTTAAWRDGARGRRRGGPGRPRLECAGAGRRVPRVGGSGGRGERGGCRRTAPLDEAAETAFVRRQRRDALAAVRLAPRSLFRPRFSRRPAAVALVALLLLAPVLLLPNPQDAVIAQQQQIREAAERQAEAIDRVAQDLETKGADANDPRTRSPRSCATSPASSATTRRPRPNLARLGAIEAASAPSSTRRTSSGPPRSRR